MTDSSRRLILTVSLLALAALLTSHVSTAQTGVSWTNVTGANTSGSSLTPTAANGRGESSQSIPAGNGSLKVIAYSYPDGNYLSFGLTNIATFTGAASEIDYGWYRFLTEHGQLYMKQYVNGSASGATPITYSSTTHRHWRIRHDPSNDTVYWETSSDGTTWTVRHSATRQLDITKLVADLYVRTWQSESSPGAAAFDNFKFEINP